METRTQDIERVQMCAKKHGAAALAVISRFSYHLVDAIARGRYTSTPRASTLNALLAACDQLETHGSSALLRTSDRSVSS